jgi:putative nucleotidyltransferase with HDIG domain
MVNSAFFRLARPATNIDQAVSYLGVAAIRNLITSEEIFSPWPERTPATFLNIQELQAHSHAVAAAAHALACDTPAADETLLAGLLHDIGYWVLAQERPDDLARAVETAVAQRVPLHDAEVSVIGASHAQIGAYLLGLWGLPTSVVEAVAHHHEPHRVMPSSFTPLAALAIAQALLPADDTSAFGTGLVAAPRVDESYLSSFTAPFDWAEAVQRVSEIFDSAEVVA